MLQFVLTPRILVVPTMAIPRNSSPTPHPESISFLSPCFLAARDSQFHMHTPEYQHFHNAFLGFNWNNSIFPDLSQACYCPSSYQDAPGGRDEITKSNKGDCTQNSRVLFENRLVFDLGPGA